MGLHRETARVSIQTMRTRTQTAYCEKKFETRRAKCQDKFQATKDFLIPVSFRFVSFHFVFYVWLWFRFLCVARALIDDRVPGVPHEAFKFKCVVTCMPIMPLLRCCCHMACVPCLVLPCLVLSCLFSLVNF